MAKRLTKKTVSQKSPFSKKTVALPECEGLPVREGQDDAHGLGNRHHARVDKADGQYSDGGTLQECCGIIPVKKPRPDVRVKRISTSRNFFRARPSNPDCTLYKLNKNTTSPSVN
jgi:hypothetical protein